MRFRTPIHRLAAVAVLVGQVVTFVLQPAQIARAQDIVAPVAPAAIADATGYVTVLVELSQPSAIEAYTASLNSVGAASASSLSSDQAAAISSVTQHQVQAVASEQAAFLGSLGSAASLSDAQPAVLFTAQRVYNGIAMRVAADQVAALSELPGVSRVSQITLKYPDHLRSMPFIGAPSLWAGSAGIPLTGKGVRIGIVDTGVDYLHTMFGGPGTGYGKNDSTKIGDVAGFPSAKIAGGYDFAGENFDPEPSSPTYQPVPHPDPDPMDCYGHGTHVAGTAGGYGVKTDGSTYAGPWTTGLTSDSLRIGPGVAPESTLYALKVFGCSGPSNIVDQALEWAADPNQDGDFSDHLDVVNLSLSSPFGDVDDTSSRAANSVSALGTIVVASSGNNAGTYFITGSPGIADRVISVAATSLNLVSDAAGGETDVLANFTARGPRRDDVVLKPDIAAPGMDITSAQQKSGSGGVSMSGTSMAAPHVAGAAALLHQLHPKWSPEEIKALLMNSAAAVVRSVKDYGSVPASPTFGGAGRVDLLSAIKTSVVAANADRPGVVSLSYGAPMSSTRFSMVHGLNVINKGSTQQSYRVYYDAITDMPGASVSVGDLPVVTVAGGATARVPVRLDFDPSQYRNLRDPSTTPPSSESAFWFGEESGYVWLWPTDSRFTADVRSLQSAATALGGLGVQSAGAANMTASFDFDTSVLSYTVMLEDVQTDDIVSIDFSRGPLGAAARTPVSTLYQRDEMSVVAAELQGKVTLSAVDRRLLGEGYLQVVVRTNAHPDGAYAGTMTAAVPALKVPLYAAPRPASDMHATGALDFGLTSQASTALAGQSLTSTQTPTQTQALVSILELHAQSPVAAKRGAKHTPASLDIRYVGIGSDFARTKSLAKSTLFVGISTYGAWTTPSLVGVDVYIDVDLDAVPDFMVYQSNRRELESLGGDDDRFVSVLYNMKKGTSTTLLPLNLASPSVRSTNAFVSDIMVLGVPMNKLGLTTGKARLTLTVVTSKRNTSAEFNGDSTGRLVYDVEQPALTYAGAAVGSPLINDTPGTALDFTLDRKAWAGSTAQGLLLFHHHNDAGSAAEIVPVHFRWQNPLYLPVIKSSTGPS